MEDSPPTYRSHNTRPLRNIGQLESMLSRVEENPELSEKLTDNLESLLFVWTALLQEKGREGWLAKARDELGNPLFTAEEAPAIEAQLKPLTDAVLALSTGRPIPQTGGGEAAPGLDEFLKKIPQAIDALDQKVHSFSEDHGVLYYQNLDDTLNKDPNLGIFGIPLIPLDESFTFNVLSKIPIPLRTIVFIANVALDALRLMVSIPGLQFPLMRKILSVGQAIFEIFQGDWKQALLSFAGVYSESAVYFGIFGKVFLNLFAMINPDFQEQILDGVLPVTKSLMIGFLLKGFQITAPAVVRRVVIDQLDKIKAQKEELDAALQKANLPPRPAYYAPTFQDIQDVQAVVRDKRLICTDLYRTFMVTMNQSIYIKLAFQLIGLPMDMGTYNDMCKDIQAQFPGQSVTPADVLVAQAKQQEEKAQEEAPIVPAGGSAQTTPTEAPSTTEAPAQPAQPAKQTGGNRKGTQKSRHRSTTHRFTQRQARR